MASLPPRQNLSQGSRAGSQNNDKLLSDTPNPGVECSVHWSTEASSGGSVNLPLPAQNDHLMSQGKDEWGPRILSAPHQRQRLHCTSGDWTEKGNTHSGMCSITTQLQLQVAQGRMRNDTFLLFPGKKPSNWELGVEEVPHSWLQQFGVESLPH